jgi:phosphatidylglycerol---prolipoprotein diacylglyceryl transferase
MPMLHSTTGPEAHFALEALAYLVGARVYWRIAARGVMPSWPDRLLLLGCTVLGALAGSKLLHVAEHFDYLLAQNQPQLWLSGKSVLGGFLGGTLGAEIGKKALRWSRPTGDPWVPALVVGLLIGRLGCQLSGTWDQTYGIPTDLPWAWDYGDGIGRHPTALYEMILLVAAFAFTRITRIRASVGASFAAFIGLYCLLRFFLEFLKPPFGIGAADVLPTATLSGLTAIQWAALLGMAWFSIMLRIRLRRQENY